MKHFIVPLCACGRHHIYGGRAECSACRYVLNPLCACGQRRVSRGNEFCHRCSPSNHSPCALCGTPSRGDVCRACNGILRRDERRTRIVERLRREGFSFAEIGQRMGGITRQRVEQILNREKQHARATVARALKRGRLEKPVRCERCGKETHELDAHHGDHRQRLDVNWLCRVCHNYVHPHRSQAIQGDGRKIPA